MVADDTIDDRNGLLWISYELAPCRPDNAGLYTSCVRDQQCAHIAHWFFHGKVILKER